MRRASSNTSARPYRDRHGKTRWRVRVGKQQRNVPPPNHPDHRAMVAAAILDMEKKRTPHGRNTLSWVVANYTATSPAWRALGDKTKKDKSALFRRMEKAWGKYDLTTLPAVKLAELMDGVEADATHNRMLTLWRQLFAHMKKRGWRKDDPSAGIERRKWTVEHTHIWTDQELDAYRRRWPLGSKQRAAFHLMFDTRQACADAAHMGRRMEDDGLIKGRRVKTRGQYTVSISDDLEAAIAPFRSLTTYLLTHKGESYSERGLHNAMSDWIEAAGLPKACTPHGLRGAGLTRDAEAGATEKELMETGGFQNTSEVKIYIREADRRKLAETVARKRSAVHPAAINDDTSARVLK